MPVPPLLRDAAAWTWRLLVLALGAYLLVRLVDLLYLISLPFIAAMLAAALVQPVVRWLRGQGLGRGPAASVTVLGALVVFAGIAYFVVNRVSAEYPELVDQLSKAVSDTRDLLVQKLHVRASSIDNLQAKALEQLGKHRSTVTEGLITGIGVVGEVLAGLVLWFFITFFLLWDGDRIWDWVVGLFPRQSRWRVHGSGIRAWERLAGYVRGTFAIAVFHGVVAAVALLVLGVPLVAPLAVLVFIGSFIPIVGAVIFGGLAAIVALVTQGWVAALVFVAVLVVDNQIEAHVLQPFLVGRYVHLHPLAVAVAITAGGLLQGLAGAVLAVPLVAAVHAIVLFLREPGEPPPDEPMVGETPPEEAAPGGEAPAAPA